MRNADQINNNPKPITSAPDDKNIILGVGCEFKKKLVVENKTNCYKMIIFITEFLKIWFNCSLNVNVY